jgi:multiple sugar transport system ATP-binding protein
MFVGGFIGAPSMNFINCKVDGNKLIAEDAVFNIPEKYNKIIEKYKGKEVVMGIRPEDIYDSEYAENVQYKSDIKTKIKVVEKLGSENLVYFDKFGKTITSRVVSLSGIRSGDVAALTIDCNKIHLFDKDSEMALLS